MKLLAEPESLSPLYGKCKDCGAIYGAYNKELSWDDLYYQGHCEICRGLIYFHERYSDEGLELIKELRRTNNTE